MKKISKQELNDILEQHKLWLKDKTKGKRANLNGADLRDSDLRYANLIGIDLKDSDLRGVDLSYAILKDANLIGVGLRDSDLRGVNLNGADLRDADLRGVDLSYADLRGANLRGTNLDFSCLPLWCGSLYFKVDERILKQIAYHFLSLCQYNQYNYKDIIKNVNTSHLVTEYILKKIQL